MNRRSPDRPVQSQDDNTLDVCSNPLERRQVLKAIAGAAALLLTPLSATLAGDTKRVRLKGRKRGPKLPPGVRRNPRYVHKKKPKGVATRLSPGFYLNPGSQVIHLVTPERRIARVFKINESRLRPIALEDIAKLQPINSSVPHVNFSVASHGLESAALSKLQAGDSAMAGRLLLRAIFHDQFFKLGTREDASLRLYDLLAGVVLRYQTANLTVVVRLIKDAQRQMGSPRRRSTLKRSGRRRVASSVAIKKTRRQPSAYSIWQKDRKRAMKAAHISQARGFFASRIRKWDLADHPWKRRWSDKRTPIEWKLGKTTIRLSQS